MHWLLTLGTVLKLAQRKIMCLNFKKFILFQLLFFICMGGLLYPNPSLCGRTVGRQASLDLKLNCITMSLHFKLGFALLTLLLKYTSSPLSIRSLIFLPKKKKLISYTVHPSPWWPPLLLARNPTANVAEDQIF